MPAATDSNQNEIVDPKARTDTANDNRPSSIRRPRFALKIKPRLNQQVRCASSHAPRPEIVDVSCTRTATVSSVVLHLYAALLGCDGMGGAVLYAASDALLCLLPTNMCARRR